MKKSPKSERLISRHKTLSDQVGNITVQLSVLHILWSMVDVAAVSCHRNITGMTMKTELQNAQSI